MTTRTRAAIVALALAAVVLLAAILGVPFGADRGPDVITQPLAPAAIADPAQPNTIEVPAKDLEQAAADVGDHADSRNETPDAVPHAELAAGQRQQELFAAQDQLPAVAPLAAPQQAGCRTRMVRNYSSRRGVAPKIWVIHYTVSANRPGRADMDALTAYANSPSSGVSWTFLADDEGHCDYNVRETDKPWTQATHNPWSLSMEIIATGREGRLTSTIGLAKIGRVISDSAGRWNIPLRLGAVSGCTVTRTGIVDHRMLGACGGGHHDISPYRVQAVIDAALAHRRGTAGNLRTLTVTERARVNDLLARRRTAHRNRGWSRVAPEHLTRATAARTWIRQRLRGIADGDHANRPDRRSYLRRVESTPTMRHP